MLEQIARFVGAFVLVGCVACALGVVFVACSAAFAMFETEADDDAE